MFQFFGSLELQEQNVWRKEQACEDFPVRIAPNSQSAVPEIGQKDLTGRMGDELLMIAHDGQRETALSSPIAQLVRQQPSCQIVVRFIAVVEQLER